MYEDLLNNAIGAGMLVFFIILGAAFYVYGALTMMYTARRLKTEPDWLAWIPVGNLVLMAKMAKMHWWPVLLLVGAFIPFVNILALLAFMVFAYIWWWRITEARGMEGWFVLLTLVPFVGGLWGLVLCGLLAWKD